MSSLRIKGIEIRGAKAATKPSPFLVNIPGKTFIASATGHPAANAIIKIAASAKINGDGPMVCGLKSAHKSIERTNKTGKARRTVFFIAGEEIFFNPNQIRTEKNDGPRKRTRTSITVSSAPGD